MSIATIFIKRALFAAIHGKGFLGRADLLSKLLFISKAQSPVALDIKDLPHPIYAQTGSDVAMIIEMFSDHEYEFKNAENVKRIIDIGANIGSASLYFTTQFPSSEIIAVEPDPQNIPKLELNTKPYSNIKILKGAADISSGERTFYSDKNVGMSSSFTKRSDNQQAYTVSTYTLSDIAHKAGWESYDMLKFDVEGAEWNLFETRPSHLPRYIIGEYHEDITSKTVEEFIALFPDYDAKKRNIAPQRYILQFVKKIS